jgi:prolipoprotein diacylglyceryltransferase
MNQAAEPRSVLTTIKRFLGDAAPAGRRNRSRAGLIVSILIVPLLLGLLACLHIFSKKQHAPGVVALVTLAGYCVLRFFIEYLRADNALVFGSHTFTQVICVALLVVSAVSSRFLTQQKVTVQEAS